MNEETLVKGLFPKARWIFAVIAIIGLILACSAYVQARDKTIASLSYSEKKIYEDHQYQNYCYKSGVTCSTCRDVKTELTANSISAAMASFCGAMFVALIISILFTGCSLLVTEKRVYCKIFWLYQICLPVDSITAVGRFAIFQIVSIGAPAGRIIMPFVMNSKAVYTVLNDLFVARQEKSLAAVMGIYSNWQW